MNTSCMILRRAVGRVAGSAFLLAATVGLVGCDLVEVTNPTRLEEDDIANPVGADLMRRNALREFYVNAARSAELSGVFADEYHVDRPTSGLQGGLDLRRDDNPQIALYRQWQELRHSATLALSRLAADARAGQRSAHMGEMFAVRGYAVLRMGEDFCPGFPLHELNGYTPVYGEPLQATADVLARAVADLDSAIVYAADSARIQNLARLGLGRTLLGLGLYAKAAAAVEAVPLGYVSAASFGDLGSGTDTNPLARLTMPRMGPVGSVSDAEGGNGIDFVSAADPRVATTYDDEYERWRPNKYLDWNSPMVIASGIEARLIEAEAALSTGGPWIQILNDLRATSVSPSLPPLTDPGTDDARVDLLFRERAFWLFGTGQRLSDLRRLVRQYGRSSESVFPSGTHPSGDVYGTGTSMLFPADLEAEFNPAVTGCTAQ